MPISKYKIDDLELTNLTHTVEPDDTIETVLQKFKVNNIGSVVVTEGKKVVGIFTERDFVMKLALSNEEIFTARVRDFMTPNPMSVKRDDPFAKALMLMRMGRFRHLVVVDENDQLYSVISIKDVMDYLDSKIKDFAEELARIV